MPVKIQRPLTAPDWFNFFVNGLETLLNRLDRQQVKFLRVDFTYADANTVISMGAIPGNAVILPSISGVIVHEVFNAATTNTFAMGTAAATTLYGTGKPLTALGLVPLTAAVLYRPSDTDATEIKLTVTTTGAAATTGKATAVIAYIVSQES